MNFADKLRELRERAVSEGWGMHSPLSDYLLHHAAEIEALVRAEEVLCGHAPGDDLEAEACAAEALSALNDELSPEGE